MGPARKLTYSKGMSFGFPGRWAMVCAIATVSGAAIAQEPPPQKLKVAIIDLSEDPAADKLRDQLYHEILNHRALTSTDNLQYDAMLKGRFLDEDELPLKEAITRRNEADSEDALYHFANAETAVNNGLQDLLVVTPAKAAPIAADLAFDYGQAEQYQQRKQAAAWFQFAHRLDPKRKLDPVKIDPDILAGYDKAVAMKPVTRQLTVRGSGRVWIDGIEYGDAMGTFAVDDGYHLVQLAGPERTVKGRVALVQKDEEVAIDPAPALPEVLVARARLALRQAPADSLSRAAPMKRLAELLDVHDAVLIWKSPDGKLLVQTWQDHAPGFSALREYSEDEPAGPILDPLAPPAPPKLEIHDTFKPPPFVPPPVVETEPPWYQKRWVQASVAGGVIAAVIGGIVWARHTGNVTIGPNAQWQGMMQ